MMRNVLLCAVIAATTFNLVSAQDPNAYIAIYNETSSSVDPVTGTTIFTFTGVGVQAYTNITFARNNLAIATNFPVPVSTACAYASSSGLVTPPCDPAATCTEVEQSIIQCACPTGYTDASTSTSYTGFTAIVPTGLACNDTDECGNSTVCGPQTANCTNTIGSYSCGCNTGYSLSTSAPLVCEDVDECTLGTHNCTTNGNCTNLPGTFTCSCNAGYTGNGFTSCTDINECTLTGYDCGGATGTCVNNLGSYTCNCNPGFVVDTSVDPFQCNDIDECLSSPCDPNAACANVVGSFSCACNAGFTGNGTSCTGNVQDYCYRMVVTLSGSASPTAIAVDNYITNILGELQNSTSLIYLGASISFETALPSGGNTEVIASVCFNGTTESPDDFTNLLQSHSTALTLDSLPLVSLDDYNECMTNYGNCSNLSNCTNTNGSFWCQCYDYTADLSQKNGFTMNGSVCELPVNFTCFSNRVEVQVLLSYFHNLNINTADIKLGGCAGTVSGDYLNFVDNGCNSTTADNTTHLTRTLLLMNVMGPWFVNSAVNFTVTCAYLKSQNVSTNFTSVLHTINRPIDGLLADFTPTLEMFLDSSRTIPLPSAPIKTNVELYLKVADQNANLPSDFRLIGKNVFSHPATDPTQRITLVSNGCRASSTALNSEVLNTVTVNNNGLTGQFEMKVRSHFYQSSSVTTMVVQYDMCLESGGASCLKTCSISGRRRRSLYEARVKRQSEDFDGSVENSIARDSDDDCNLDCESGICWLDAFLKPVCVCADNTEKVNGKCYGPNDIIPGPNEETEAIVKENRTTIWVLIGLAVFILLLVVVLIVAFCLRKYKSYGEMSLMK